MPIKRINAGKIKNSNLYLLFHIRVCPCLISFPGFVSGS